ncbi:TonB-dependent receptor [Sphingomonas sp. CGMCC 1.13654]|uniref:TonB-dependent receptor n=1 Tax=Sphingomonas chungangi TaxID=2683589 RepID=A0A838LA79_9SPHN|nr:TonB-dependent receptor [Sphingomonas chungangi]MBA2935016.1 TonB-dependent receptor [Sphingomonas chungangi]MVW54131.1 TonB-dependent receptor [Sphingomonas chungangi]
MLTTRIIARASVSALALAAIAPAFAQSTGTQEFDKSQIVVTAKNGDSSVAGTAVSSTPKAKTALTDEFIGRQRAGQSIDDIINMLPGVSFQNNGPYGDAGGTLTIHGFDSSRISQTFDGIPLNDSGNYALYSQEQVDPEIIKQVEVSTGSTDIDSPTASATGGTVNYTIRDPSEDFHVRFAGSMGQWQFMRLFGVVDTGDFTKYGTRAFVSASKQSDVNPYDSGSKLDRKQVNAKVYQPIGSNGDFVSVTGFYDRNRGDHFNDFTLQESSFPGSASDISAKPPICTVAAATPGKADKPNACATSAAGYYGYTQNPTNIWQIHLNSRFTLANGLILTVEPNVGYTEANGGSIVTATEGNYTKKVNGQTIYGFIGGKPYLGGVDLNGDGDTLDTVSVDAPSNTITHRYGVIANLIWHIAPTQTVRVNYTLDHAKLYQTGELGYLAADGRPVASFPKNDPILDASGNPIEKRDRLSYSILNQVSGEYRGEFFDNKLVLQAGVRAPFFKRDLNNRCVSESGGNGYVDCFNDPASQAAFLAANPSYQAPQSRHDNYNKVLPSAGFTYNFTPHVSAFGDYSQGLQVPSTDTLYDGFAFPVGDPAAKPKMETSYNFEGGLRYKSHNIQAQLSGWYTSFHNKIEESTIEDPQNPGGLPITVYTNLGTVHKYGFDGSISYAPDHHFTLYAFGSYLHSKILDNLQQGLCTANNVKFGDSGGLTGTCMSRTQPIIRATGGKQESGSPSYMFGGRVQGSFGPLEVGVQAKRTGPRYVNDQNTPVLNENDLSEAVYPAKTPSYTLVDLDARLNLGFLGLNDKTYLQLNVTNLFDKFYVGGFSGQVGNLNYPAQYVYVGTPRTFSGTVNIAF